MGDRAPASDERDPLDVDTFPPIDIDTIQQGDFSRFSDWNFLGGPAIHDPENPPPDFAAEGRAHIEELRKNGTMPDWLEEMLVADPRE